VNKLEETNVSFIDEESIEEELEDAIRNPFVARFRPEPPEYVIVDADSPISHAEVDLVNENVELRYRTQRREEKYVVVAGNSDVGLVETHALISNRGAKTSSVSYYLVTDEQNFFHDGYSYEETPITRPRHAHEKAMDLYEKAKELDSYDFQPASLLHEQEETSGRTLPEVPLPENDSMAEK